MRVIVQSIKPKWAQLIWDGEKVGELRKNSPIAYPVGDPILVYESGTGMITGLYYFGGIATNYSKPVTELARMTCLTVEQLRNYGTGHYGHYNVWLVDRPAKFTVPIPIGALGLKHPPMSWQYIDIDACEKLWA